MSPFASLLSLAFAYKALAQTYSATYLPTNTPNQTEAGQSGTNECGTASSQNSSCQNVYVNSLEDWCIFAPPEPGADSTIGETERIEVAWCIQGNHGTRVIPDGTITGAHFVQTPDYVQVTGIGNLTMINIPNGDEGGELDPHGADGNGNPIGGLVFTNAFNGTYVQAHEWTNFVAFDSFCIRACKDSAGAPALCNHIYDVMGCDWNMPGNYSAGFDTCLGDSDEAMGVYGTSTFEQGQASTPSAHTAAPTSSCTISATIGNTLAASTTGSSSATSTGSGSGSGTSRSTGSASATSASSTNGAAEIHLPSLQLMLAGAAVIMGGALVV